MKQPPEDIKLVIFDVDGTLVDAYQAIADSINYMMVKMGLPPQSLQTVTRSVGHGVEGLVSCFIEEARTAEALRIFRTHHDRRLRQKLRIMPGARALLAALQKRGCRMAIASNRPEQFCRIILEQLKLDKYFDWIICGDMVKNPKPHPEILRVILRAAGVKAGQAVYVGDMTVDVLCGRRARVFTLALPTGSSTRAELQALKPDRIIPGLSKVLSIFPC
ncbi:MAG: HAD family hydrolase [Candidatus Omnitrophica bacterium]|nr:HAD family hydrolase [Candidatus Omnitrophota bacterium]